MPNSKCQGEVCTGATELCKKYCYGNCVFRHSDDINKKKLSTEKIAQENYTISIQDDFVEQMNELIKRTKDLSMLRIHSIGDFYNYTYFLKWIDIINANKHIHFTAYVKNFMVLEKYMKEKKEVPDNFNILLSIYPDTYDKYAAYGGEEYIDRLFKKLLDYYNAKIYKVCSREYIHSKIKSKDPTLHICNGGMNKLCKLYNLDAEDFKDIFVPDQRCSECMKCYSNTQCPPGSTIYAVLRSSSSLANLKKFLNANKNQFSILRELYQKNQI